MPNIEDILDIIGKLDGIGLIIVDEDLIVRSLEAEGYSHDTNIYECEET